MNKWTTTFCKQATVNVVAWPEMQGNKQELALISIRIHSLGNTQVSTLTLHVCCTSSWLSRVTYWMHRLQLRKETCHKLPLKPISCRAKGRNRFVGTKLKGLQEQQMLICPAKMHPIPGSKVFLKHFDAAMLRRKAKS